MEVVLDANVLFRTLISPDKIVDLFFNNNLIIFAPERLKEEFVNNKEEILKKSILAESDFDNFSNKIFQRIIFVNISEYKEFIPKAKQLLGKHEKDEDFIALCLLKRIKLWTYEKLLFEIGFGISTKEISEKLIQTFK